MTFRIHGIGRSVDFRTIDKTVEVGPHPFGPLGRFRHRDKCGACYLPRSEHPTGWTPARPIGDKR